MGTMHSAILVCVVIQAAILVAVLTLRGKVTPRTYISDEPRYNWAIIALTTSATVVGGGMFVGVSKVGFEAGAYGFLLGLIYLFGFSLFAMYVWKLVEKLRASQCDSINELLAKVYSKRVAVIFSVVNFIIFLALLSAQFLAIQAVVSYFVESGLDWRWAWLPISLTVLGFLIYSTLGGLRRDIICDVAQWIIMAGGLILILYLVTFEGNMSTWPSRLPASHWTGFGYGLVLTLGTITFLLPSFFVRTDLWQRANTAKTMRDAKIGFVLAGVISALSYTLFTLTGMAARADGLVNSEFALMEFLSARLRDAPILGIVLGAFLGAVLSSADTYINNFSINVCRSIWPGQSLSLSKLLGASLSGILIAAALAFWLKDIVDLVIASFSLLLIFFVPIVGIWSPKWASERGAFWGMSLSLIVFGISLYVVGAKLAFIPAVATSLLVHIAFRITGLPRTAVAK